MILLTGLERDRFASYLEREASDNQQLIKQAARLPGIVGVAKVLKQDAIAYAYVAARLRAVEDQTIGAVKAKE